MAFGLGKGLEALIPNKKPVRPDPVVAPVGVSEVELGKIQPNPHQPRKRFAVEHLEDLASSIRAHGILEPLVVSPSSGDGYILVAGERRLRAAELAGLKKVPVVVRATDDREKLELALVENIQRQDLNPLEEARALRKLLRDFRLSQQAVAERVGRSRSAVANCLRLLDLAPEVQKALLEETISEGHARALLGCSSQARQLEILQQIVELHLSVRHVERMVKTMSTPLEKRSSSPSLPDPRLERDARQLGRALGTRVQLVGAPRGGRIVIEYYSEDERARLVKQLTQIEKSARRTETLNEFSV
jgi:ParB family chromosome partitioning protein